MELWQVTHRLPSCCGSERDGKSTAIIYTLIEIFKLNGVKKQAGLTRVPERPPEHKFNRMDEPLSWTYPDRCHPDIDAALKTVFLATLNPFDPTFPAIQSI